jgi:hypothetical protein
MRQLLNLGSVESKLWEKEFWTIVFRWSQFILIVMRFIIENNTRSEGGSTFQNFWLISQGHRTTTGRVGIRQPTPDHLKYLDLHAQDAWRGINAGLVQGAHGVQTYSDE